MFKTTLSVIVLAAAIASSSLAKAADDNATLQSILAGYKNAVALIEGNLKTCETFKAVDYAKYILCARDYEEVLLKQNELIESQLKQHLAGFPPRSWVKGPGGVWQEQ
jgi:hypothetical protein